MEQNRDDEARAVVYTLHGTSTVEEKTAAEREYLDMREVIKAEASERSRYINDLWASRPMMRRTLVAVGVQVMGQFTGINGGFDSGNPTPAAAFNIRLVINYFGPSMYKALGLSNGKALLVQGIYGAVGPIANFL